MNIPTLRGLIRRRVLVNFRVKPEVIQPLLPFPFKPKLVGGWSMAGICLIRLEQIRPASMPPFIGLSSENAAHRIAVRWDDANGVSMEGVYIPRRDSNSRFNHLLGGRLFPGEHQRAQFEVKDDGNIVDLHIRGLDDDLSIDLSGRSSETLPDTSIFASLNEASEYFRCGSLGYSETLSGKCLDGLVLSTTSWEVKPLRVDAVKSSFFADSKIFPSGSVEFDCALIMRNIQHEWQAAPRMQKQNPTAVVT